jgi:hypothetical protein
MNLLWLGDPKSFDSSLVGGKAANLSRLARMYHRVPDGFSLPVTVMDEAHPHDLQEEIIAAISDLMACHRLDDFIAASFANSVNHRITKGSPKTGVRAYARTPVFGYSFNFRDLLKLLPPAPQLPGRTRSVHTGGHVSPWDARGLQHRS